MHDISIDHNTGFENGETLFLGGTSGTTNNVQLTNNLWDYAFYGIIGNNVGSGTNALTTFLTNYAYNSNVFFTPSGGNPGVTLPSGTFYSLISGTDFTSVTGTDPNLSGNFQLTSSSPYYRAGTDGKDIGVWDWTCLNSDSAAAIAGTFVTGSGCLPPLPPTNLTAIIQ